ncbi:MAG: hypothetical protein IKZ49_00620 [Alphaproteobacteria bacterium]|nr:hypothetical protein [Alphaproteobacteria bacterium]
MTNIEFLSLIKSRGAKILPVGDRNAISVINSNLEKLKIIILPKFLSEFYTNSCFGITLGSSYIFGPQNFERGIKYPIPSILDINKDVIGNKNLFGKIIFGRNDLFWFASDAFGNCYMLDNLTLSVLRKYDDPYRAMLDCLVIGKI